LVQLKVPNQEKYCNNKKIASFQVWKEAILVIID